MSWKQRLVELGAIDFLEICIRALQRQEDRLRTATPPRPTGMDSFYEIAPDVWFAVAALHRSFRALKLARKALKADAAKTKQLKALALPDEEVIKNVRDIFEHFDEYYQLQGRLQTKRARPEHLLPMIDIEHGAEGITGVSIQTGVGGDVVDVFKAIQLMLPAVRATLALLTT